MKSCGKRFHDEVGKFRFLNELIKVVSPKVGAPGLSSDLHWQAGVADGPSSWGSHFYCCLSPRTLTRQEHKPFLTVPFT